ncbi:MAG: bioH [Ramlibacter sp.]|nr:bioH [Ramlibacter sp.]
MNEHAPLSPGSGFAEVNGARLYYETSGAGHPLVMIHGNTFDLRMWDDQFAELSKKYFVIRYDARGFGRSTVPNGSAYDHAVDLRDLLSQLGIEHAALLGLSMGGRIAINFTLAYPEGVDALIVANSGLDGFQFERPLLAEVIAEARRAGLDAAKALWRAHPLLALALEQTNSAARLSEIIHDYSGWHWFNEDPQIVSSPPAIERLAAIKTPTLVVIGDCDIPDMLRIAKTLADNIPGATRSMVPDVGHLSNMEAPVIFNHLVSSFLHRALGVDIARADA